MAATQAEPQQNDVNRDIVPQEQSPSSANNSLQNGTDKSSGRGVLGGDAGGAKGMKPAQNISVDMSQYRQDPGPPVNNSEQNTNSSDDTGSKVNNSDKPYSHNAESTPSDINYPKMPPDSGANMQGYGMPFPPQRGNFMPSDGGTGMHMGPGEPMHPQHNSYGHFGPAMRHPFGGGAGSKPPVRSGFSPQRFMPSQGMSSPPAGTPTLNQLLQSNSVHNRYPNSYGEYGMPKSSGDQAPPTAMPYSQNWPPPRPMPPYSQQNPPYRNQPPPGSQGGGNSGQGGSGPGNQGGPGQGSQSGSSQSGQAVIQSSGGGGGQQPGPGQPPPRPFPGYPSSPSQTPYHPPSPSPYRHPYQMGGGGSNGGYERGGSWSPGPGAPPQHDHPSSPSPQQQPPPQQPPPSQHQSSYQSRGAQQSPNAHAPDPAELTGQNSNDSSSGGGGGGTPNSGGGPLRPSPSPTGSSGSRSMSPAVLPPGGAQQQGSQQSQTQQQSAPPQSQPPPQQSVVMPPRPPSGQSDSGNGPSRLSHSPMAQPPVPQPGHTPMGQPGHTPMGQPGHPPMGQQSHGSIGQQTPPGGYQGPGPGPQHYKMGPNAPSGPGGMLGHMPSPSMPPQSQQIPPYSPQPSHHQYPQQSNYRNSPYYPPQSQYPPHRPAIPNHVQYPPYPHKVGGYPPSPGTFGGSQAMGPPSLHPGMPPPPPPHHDGPMPPPSSTTSDMHEPPSTTASQTGTVTSSSNTNSSGPPGVTSIVTTGPDASLDEASQQSTLSNASAASGDDTNVSTPSKARGPSGKESMVYQSSHPTTPQSTAPSPGTASINSMHEEYPPDHSPTWSRTPNSPVFNSHVPQDLYRPKKHDSLSKLYDMDESVERRMWLDKLLQYMDERGTPISSCPTISKNPLDLFRLYIHVKERGGFIEVTKNKVWKDIAGLLGIGASSSAAYTLRKHYTKNLLPFECHFDRGGIDPQPIINQVEASSKKKTTKTAPVPSPGSSNSQDSFQGPGSGSGGMDGYPGYGYPPDYNNQRPPSQSNQAVIGSQGGTSAENISVSNPFDDNAANSRAAPRPPGVQQGYPGGYGQYGDQYNQGYGGYPNRPVYGAYPEDRNYPATGQQDQYRYMGAGGGYRYPTPPGGGAAGVAGSPTPPQTGNSPAPPPSQSPAAQPEYYRPPAAEYPANQQYPPGGKTMPPPQPGPRRHPDFVKDQPQPPPTQPPYPPYNQQPHRPPPPNMYPGRGEVAPIPEQGNQDSPGQVAVDFHSSPRPLGWNNNSGGQYRGQYPGGTGTGPPGWPNNSRPGTPGGSAQWPPGAPGYQPGWAPPQPRPPRPQHPAFRPSHDSQQPPNAQPKQYPPIAPPPALKQGSGAMGSGYGPVKRELIFPEGSVEGTTPVMYKRRRLCKTDVAPVDAWRIMMALKSGLLAETTWALDVLNILLFDDTTVTYFGLLHLPGLLDILLEHMKVALQEMLEPLDEKPSEDPVDLGGVVETPDASSRTTLLHRTPDMTLRSRKGHPVSLVSGHEDLFVTDARRPWDPDDSPDRDHPDLERSKYIISSYKSEVCNIPFTRMIPGPDRPIKEEKEVEPSPSTESTSPCRLVPAVDSQPCDKTCSKKKTKSLHFALSRIKKENEEEEVEENTEVCEGEEEESKVKTETEEESKEEEDEEDKDKPTKIKEEVFNIKIKDPAGTLTRRRMSDYEDECFSKDEASLYLVSESQDWLAKRCICISTILRNLTFVPGNEAEYSKSSTFLSLVGKLLLLHHEHPPRQPKQRNYDRDEDADTGDSCSSLAPPTHWWWDFLHHLRENALVSLANISGQVDLGLYPEEVSRPILDGLLHWAVCPAAHGQDPFPTVSTSLSPQRLALEALCKLCVTDSNVDLVIATPPYCRLERLATVLTRLLCRSEEQVLREFGVNLLFYLGAADSGMARTIALQAPCISLLVGFVEQAENGAVAVANTSGLSALRENPDQAMGTSVDMVRRACRALLALSRHPSNKPLIQQHEQRLLHLVMSQVLDQSAAQTLARVLYQVSRPNPPSTPPPT